MSLVIHPNIAWPGPVPSRSDLITSFHVALEMGSVSDLRTILDMGLDPNTVEMTGKPGTSMHRKRHLIETLLDSGGTDDHKKMMQLLLREGADPKQAICRHGYTSTMYAIDRNRLAAACMLIKAGDNVNARAPNGMTAMHMACKHFFDTTELLDVLEHAGADICAELPGIGHTPLMLAARNPQKIRWLLQRAPHSLNAQDSEGLNALMHAIDHRSLEGVQLLIAAGADLTQKTDKGQDALAYAKQVHAHSKNLPQEMTNMAKEVHSYLRMFMDARQANSIISGIASAPKASPREARP